MLQQSKSLPASQVQNNFGGIVKQVRDGEYTEVIVENRGEPVVAIVNVEELQAMREFREKEKRSRALEKLRALRAKIQTRLKEPLPDEEVEAIAERFSRELISGLEKRGKVRFERKSP